MCTVIFSTAQVSGDTLEIWTFISFEEPSEDLFIDPSPDNLWQIGIPQKSYFNQAYTVPNAIVTDTINWYPVRNKSFFDVYFNYTNTHWGYSRSLFLDFQHKFDTDTLKDGGYISVSWDMGLTWTNIIDDSLSNLLWYVSPASPGMGYGNINVYVNSDTLFNGEHGYSGKSNGWVKTSLAWYNLAVKGRLDFPPDTMILRFNFISDNDNHDKEGWMIDEIRLILIDLGSGFQDFIDGQNKAFISPNPIKSAATITLDKNYDRVDFELMDFSGRTIQEGSCKQCSSFTLQRGHINPGMYLLNIIPGKSPAETHKLVFIW
jgi:hypothetical protein